MEIGVIFSAISVAVGVFTMAALVGSMFFWAGRITARLDAIDARIDAQTERLDARIDAQTERLDGVSARLDSVDARIDALAVRIDAQTERLDARIDALATAMTALRRELLVAIAHHEHDTDGSVRFRVPPAE